MRRHSSMPVSKGSCEALATWLSSAWHIVGPLEWWPLWPTGSLPFEEKNPESPLCVFCSLWTFSMPTMATLPVAHSQRLRTLCFMTSLISLLQLKNTGLNFHPTPLHTWTTVGEHSGFCDLDSDPRLVFKSLYSCVWSWTLDLPAPTSWVLIIAVCLYTVLGDQTYKLRQPGKDFPNWAPALALRSLFYWSLLHSWDHRGFLSLLGFKGIVFSN